LQPVAATLGRVAAAMLLSTGDIAGTPFLVLRKEVDLGRDKVRADLSEFFPESPYLKDKIFVTHYT
jgi:hypothetical protein